MTDVLELREFTAPLYTQREAADLVGVPDSTFHHWARGYVYKSIDGTQRSSSALVTTTGLGRGPVVPFVGLGEAYVLAAFRRAGVPMQRIRPAVEWLESRIGLRAALTSEQLKTDGAELLWDFGGTGAAGHAVADDLVVVRNQQAVFREVVEQHLSTITYRDGRLVAIRLPRWSTPVVLDPAVNFGQPTLAGRGVRLADVRDRLSAGEPATDVAEDYGLPLADVRALAAA
ncbi:MAG TPA: DUF433 domain-containing protein [Cellulomonas sp.]